MSEMNEVALNTALECSLCLSLVCEPISISCGHTFCRVCLVKSLSRHKKKCPTCREVCHVTAENAAENIMIKKLAMTINPDLYAARYAELQSERETWNVFYPCFYYNSTMFPGSRLSLHLFEPRYKTMMQRVVNSTRKFAYVPNFTNYHASIGDIALVAELKDVEFFADGRCLLDATLVGRSRIVDHYVEDGTQGLHFCQLEPYSDTPTGDQEALASLVVLQQEGTALAAHIYNENTRTHIENKVGAPPTGLVAYSLWLTAISPMSEQEKYALLVSRNTVHRYEKCVTSLRDWDTRVNRRAAIINSATNIASSAVSLTASGFAALSSLTSYVIGGASVENQSSDSVANSVTGSDNDESGSMHSTEQGEESLLVNEDDDGEYLDVEFTPDTHNNHSSDVDDADNRRIDDDDDEEERQEDSVSQELEVDLTQLGFGQGSLTVQTAGVNDSIIDNNAASTNGSADGGEYIDIQLFDDGNV